VEVKLRYAEQCYNELSVLHRNASFFLLPKSRILSKIDTQKDCNDILAIMYKMHGIRLTSKPVEVLAPPIIEPLTKLTQHYNLLLAPEGLKKELKRLSEELIKGLEGLPKRLLK